MVLDEEVEGPQVSGWLFFGGRRSIRLLVFDRFLHNIFYRSALEFVFIQGLEVGKKRRYSLL